MGNLKEHTYYIKGMHCASCEVLIEKKLLAESNIKSVDVSLAKGLAIVEYENDLPNIGKTNGMFEKYGYTFFNHQPRINDNSPASSKFSINAILIAAVIAVLLFFVLPRTSLAGLVSLSSKSTLPAFFVFGLLAGISSCAALVGGIVLSMSKQWSELYSSEDRFVKKVEPHILFNAGRLISYAALGGILGAIGSTFRLSPTVSSILIIVISILMVLLGLQMFGVKALRRFQISAPKGFSRYVADEKNFKGKYMPMVLGALTFFLPCGFTITAQSLALLSGNFIQGMLIMLAFALGTLPMLLTIGFSSVKFLSNPKLSNQFLKVAGALVLLFALFNINSQLNVLGMGSLNDLVSKPKQTAQNTSTDDGLPPIVDGKQILKTDASASGYTPNYLKVRAGIPVKWEITDKGTSGCTNAVIAKGLFSDSIALTNGQTSEKEFTVNSPGKYKFSCWMGMISGTIEVVAKDSAASTIKTSQENLATAIPSGAKGCGCGGLSSGSAT